LLVFPYHVIAQEVTMVRERTLRIVLVIVGLLFVAGVYPLVMFFSREPTVPMLMSIYVTLGIFLLLAARNPVESRNLIAFAGWANVAHAAVMTLQEARHVIEARELAGVVLFGVVGIVLIVLTPGEKSSGQMSSARAA
jgi:succinate-acetate transporter protein